MKVLIVEDDVDLLDLTTYALRREGYEVVAAVDGKQALARWEAERPDLVLLDGNLPGLNGFEVCRRIRQAGATPTVMLTDLERRVLRLSATGLLTDEVAEHLGIGVDEVRLHLGGAMVALGARSKLEAVVLALRAGLLDLA